MKEAEAADGPAPGGCRRPARSGIPEMPRKVGYLSVFDPADRMGIDRQRELVDRATPPDAGFGYVVDVGWPDGNASCPPALFEVVRAARMRAVDVVSVECIARFARERSAAVRIATILCDSGVQIREVAREGIRAEDPHRLPERVTTRARGRRKVRSAAETR